ncbi:MAG: YfhO family protein [Nitrospinales bacterium]
MSPTVTAREVLVAGFLFACLAVGYFWEMAGSDPIFSGGDAAFFFIPLRKLWVQAAQNFSFPLWNPFSLTGMPLFATMQPAILYPFSLFYLFLPFYLVFNLTVILHYGLAGLAMYLLMRGLRCGIAAAAVSGLTFMLSGYLFSLQRYPSTLFPVAWVPLLLLCYFAGLLKNDRRYALLAAGAGAVMLFAGGVETCYQVFPWLVVFTVFPRMVFAERPCPSGSRRLSYLVVFFAAWAGLSAIQLLPAFELSRWSIRSQGLPIGEAAIWSLKFRELPLFFFLDLYGYFTGEKNYLSNQNWMQTLYLGAIPFLLSGYYFRKGGTRVWSFLLVIVWSLALALGSNTPLFVFLREYMPFFDAFRYPVKFILPAVLVIAMAAGLGYDRFQKDIRSANGAAVAWSRKLLILAVGSILVFASIDFFNDSWVRWFTENGLVPPTFNRIWVNLGNLQRLLAFTAVFCLLWFLAANISISRQWLLRGSVCLLALDLFFGSHGLSFKIAAERYDRASANMQRILSDPGLYRVYLTPETRYDFFHRLVREQRMRFEIQNSMVFPLIGVPHGMYYVSGFVIMRPLLFENVKNLLKGLPPERRMDLLNMLNVKYIVSADKLNFNNLKLVNEEPVKSPKTARPAKTKETIKLYENPDALPRAYLVSACRQVRSEKEYPETFSGKNFQPRKIVLLDESPEKLPCGPVPPSTPAPAHEDESVVFSKTGLNSLALTVKLESRKFLFLSEAWYPGWEATVDGKPAKIYRANFAFRALLLEPGTHAVRFDYNPMSFRAGLAISLATLLIGIFMWRKTANERTQP